MLLAIAVVAVATQARADPFWVSWTGEDYPENQGWKRASSDPAALRWLEGGQLTIDSRAEWGIYEEYWQSPIGMLTLEPGERFVMAWRLLVSDIPWGGDDPGVAVTFDGHQEAIFLFFTDAVESVYDPGQLAAFEPGVYHVYTFVTDDIQTHVLYIDGTPALEGVFFDSLFGPGVSWGDVTSGKSLAQWDHFEYGIESIASTGDVNCDGGINAFDIDPFVLALTDVEAYYIALPQCDHLLGDIDASGSVDAFDIDPFIVLLVGD
jgi:hypothetical protein